ncbi:hypothetical protein [Frisingicoccus sp.]|uniref:hypothetical protein n=1 Tax=Frisingicoccus sp. TaxID=1918627 RepID=UPI003AB3E884
MNIDKLSDNVKFTVNYDDGTEKKVSEGVLFEFDGSAITLHLGTSRKEALFSIAPALVEFIGILDLDEEFKRYIEENIIDEEGDADA